MAAGAWHGGAIAETQQPAAADARLQMPDPVIELDCVSLVHDELAATAEATGREQAAGMHRADRTRGAAPGAAVAGLDDVVDRVAATSRHLVAAPCR